MRKCKHLTDDIKGRSKWLRSLIKEDEKIVSPNILQQYNLCSHYETLYHAPFANDMSEFYECCKKCKLKTNDNAVFNALHSKEYGEIIWGKVLQCTE